MISLGGTVRSLIGMTVIASLVTASAGATAFAAPVTYTPNQVVHKAIHQSFTTQIEFQKVARAATESNLAALNLIPHITINSIAEILTPLSFIGLLKVAGDLVPFLLPSKWAAVETKRDYKKAEEYALLTEKADAGQISASIAYAILANDETAAKLADNRKLTETIRDEIKSRERTGIFQVGTSDDVTAVLNGMDVTSQNLVDLTQNGYVSLSESAGFENPHAIGKVVDQTEPVSAENPAPLDEAALRKAALSRSTELRQMSYLIAAAKSDEVGRQFEWLDPKGDPSGGLGFGLPSFVKIAAIQADQIRAQQRQVAAITAQKVSEVINDLKKAATQYQTAIQGKLIQERRIARITNNLNLGISFALADLVTALQGRLESDIQLTNSKYLYLSSWNRLNRLIYSGPYAGLSPAGSSFPGVDRRP